jgi:cation transport ATPase
MQLDQRRGRCPGECPRAAIEALVGGFGRVAMLGDGVNGAPAMAAATL